MNRPSDAAVEACLQDLKQGKMIVVIDDEERENEGDLVVAAEFVTPSVVNFMLQEARGMLFVAVDGDTSERLKLASPVAVNTSQRGTNYTVSVDALASFGVTTGVSAGDRATTIRRLGDPRAVPEDFDRPGHVPPVRARDGGVLVRAGHTEALTDLCRLAGLQPVAAGIEIMRPDGEMARRPDLDAFCKKHEFSACTVEDLIRYRMRRETLVRRLETVTLPTKWGTFTLHAYDSTIDQHPHLALCKGGVGDRKPDGTSEVHDEPVLVRVHSECLTGDIFGSAKCDCGDQLALAMQRIEQEGKGVLLYLRQEGRGIGLTNKLHAYKLQEQGYDTIEANRRLGLPTDRRDYGIGTQILRDLGLRKLRILTNNPKKIYGIEGYGLEVVEQLPVRVEAGEHNRAYLNTKREKMGHTL